jgi:hypothetical protein
MSCSTLHCISGCQDAHRLRTNSPFAVAIIYLVVLTINIIWQMSELVVRCEGENSLKPKAHISLNMALRSI